jgi:hypothetical protein
LGDPSCPFKERREKNEGTNRALLEQRCMQVKNEMKRKLDKEPEGGTNINFLRFMNALGID